MSHLPFDMFKVTNVITNKFFTINSLHIAFFFVFAIVMYIGLLFKSKSNNFIYNFIFDIWNMINNLLNHKDSSDNGSLLLNKDDEPLQEEINPRTWFFFTTFLLMLIGNMVSRLPGINPFFSLMIVSIPLHSIIILYLLFFAIQIHKTKIINVFFNSEIILPMRILIGGIEVVSLFVKIFSFSIRLLANITAGHILMWVIEMFIKNVPLFIKPMPFVFLVIIYMMELAIGVLQSYIFLLLSITIFKSMEHIHHA